MFERMLSHPNITVRTGVACADLDQESRGRRLIWTGPIEEYSGFSEGRLPYRWLRFVHETRDTAQMQSVGTVNYPQDEASTRSTEYKPITGQLHPRASLTTEYPAAEGEPYYPIPRPENQAMFKRYQALGDAERDVWSVGRLATYRYDDMDQIVAQAPSTFERIKETGLPGATVRSPV